MSELTDQSCYMGSQISLLNKIHPMYKPKQVDTQNLGKVHTIRVRALRRARRYQPVEDPRTPHAQTATGLLTSIGPLQHVDYVVPD